MNERVQGEVLSRLASTRGHLEGVCRMVRRGSAIREILDQIRAVRGSLAEVETFLVREALYEYLREPEPGRSEKLERVWALVSRKRSFR